ncbi:MAG: hypothetical protein ACRDOV_10080 [Streptomyces sp.]
MAVTVAVPVLALSVAACGGGDEGEGDGGGKAKDGQGQQSGEGKGKDGTGGGDGASGGTGAAEGVPPLDEKRLTAALLKTGDVKGYRAQRSKEDALPPQNTMTSDDPRCSAITDAVGSKPKHARTAYTSGTLMKGKGTLASGGAIQQVLLSAYGKGEAAQWLGELKDALDSCKSFTGKVGTGEETQLRIEPGEGVGVGDDSVRFTMKDAKGKDSPTVFTVVRTGGNTATFMSISLSGEPVPVTKAVVVKQHEKLTAAAKG